MKTCKILLLSFCLMTFFFNQKSSAQTDVTLNPLGLLFSNINVGADFALAENFSIEGNLGASFGSTNIFEDEFKYFGIPVTVFGKYYFNPDEGADKFYADAWLRFISRKYSYEGGSTNAYSDYSQTRFGFGFGIGYKVVANSGLVFDIGFGAGKAFVDNTKYDDSNLDELTVDWPKIMFVGKLGIGYRFGSN